MAGGIIGALDRSRSEALGAFLPGVFGGHGYIEKKILTRGVANIAIPVAVAAVATVATILTLGTATPITGPIIAGSLAAITGAAAGAKQNSEAQAASAQVRQQAAVVQQQQQQAQVYATAHPVLSQVETWWQEYPTAIMAGAGLLAVAAIIHSTRR